MFSVTSAASTIITLSESQLSATFNLANYISSYTGYCNFFSRTIDNCKILKYGASSPYDISTSLSSSTFNVVFDPT